MDFFENDLQFTKIIFRDRFYYPPEINAAIHHMVAYLRGSITSNTPFIYLFAHNHIKTIIAFFAIIKSGHVCVLVDPEIGKLELAEMKQDTPPCALVHMDPVTGKFDYSRELVFTDDNPQEYDWDELSDVAMIMYTNAEDGYAKGAMLTRRNLLANAEAGQISDAITERNVFCALLPFHHMFGLQTGVLTPLYAGSTFVIEDISTLTKIGLLAASIMKHKVTNLYSVPVVYFLFSKVPGIKNVLSSVEKICSGACALPKMVYEQFLQKTGKQIAEGYGLTEASPVCTWHWKDDMLKIGSAGRAYPCCEVAVFDPGNKKTSPGQVGVVRVKGSNVMKGYFKNKKATEFVFNEGWLRGGDLGYLDSEGYLYITGIVKNMANIAGRKVYPLKIERLFKMCNVVKDSRFVIHNHPLFSAKCSIEVSLKHMDVNSIAIFKKWYFENLAQNLSFLRVTFQ